MNDATNNTNGYEPTREDVLIGRVSDGEATPSDWSELERLAAADGGVWSRLASAQRAHARLSEAVEDEIAVSELVGLPKQPMKFGSLAMKGVALAGWGVAAALALTVVNPSAVGPTPAQSTERGAIGLGTAQLVHYSPTELRDAYIQRGRLDGTVFGELPARLVDLRGLGEGNGQEVLIVRPIIEKVRVSELEVMGVEETDTGESMFIKRRVPETFDGRAL